MSRSPCFGAFAPRPLIAQAGALALLLSLGQGCGPQGEQGEQGDAEAPQPDAGPVESGIDARPDNVADAAPDVLLGPPGHNCGMQKNDAPVALCETFDAPAGVGNRSGDLNGTLWGVSRATGDINYGRPFAWVTSQLDLCGSMVTADAESDIRICNGQLRESSDDNITGGFEAGGVTALTMYIKQPFDFAGRTGTVAFDVTNDTAGSHSAWPEFWLTDKPIPSPFAHFGSWVAFPRDGFAVRFGAECQPGNQCICNTPDTQNSYRWTVDSAAVVRNYVSEDTAWNPSPMGVKVQNLDCVTEPPGPNGGTNHVELRISQNQIDVYASDAGVRTPLKHIAVITNANLTLTRGLPWFDDVHYNADKGDPGRPTQHNHTFAWDNVAFDGPILARDLSFDVLDSLTPVMGGKLLGWDLTPMSPVTLTTLPMATANIGAASGALLMFYFWSEMAPVTFTYSVNGHAHTGAWPFTGPNATLAFTPRSVSFPVPLSDLVDGPNTITLGADNYAELADVNIALVGAAGIVPP